MAPPTVPNPFPRPAPPLPRAASSQDAQSPPQDVYYVIANNRVYSVRNAANGGHAVHVVKKLLGVSRARLANGCSVNELGPPLGIDAAEVDQPAPAPAPSPVVTQATVEELQAAITEAVRRGTFRAHVRFVLWALLVWLIVGALTLLLYPT